MENKTILSVEELININEIMLGRGVPNREDGIGYNKADYGACANYFYGMSDAQIADLAKRLVKYSQTQLHLDKQMMKDTAEYYKEIAGVNTDRTAGVSVDVTENGTLISFRYNETFIEIIKQQPKRQYNQEHKQWVVPNENALSTLEALAEVGAEVKNAIEYVSNHPLCKKQEQPKETVLVKDENDWVLLKFKYNQNILDLIRKIDRKDRQWNSQYKFWAIKKDHLESIQNTLNDTVNFKWI